MASRYGIADRRKWHQAADFTSEYVSALSAQSYRYLTASDMVASKVASSMITAWLPLAPLGLSESLSSILMHHAQIVGVTIFCGVALECSAAAAAAAQTHLRALTLAALDSLLCHVS